MLEQDKQQSKTTDAKVQGKSDTLAQRIKNATGDFHHNIENSPFFKKMGQGEISEKEYITYLKIMAHYNWAIETLAEKCKPKIQKMVYDVGYPLTHLVQNDLNHFGATLESVAELQSPGLEFSLEQIQKNETDAHHILGFVYLIAGSQHGASYIAKVLQKKGLINEEFEGAHYLASHGLESLHHRWKNFLSGLEGLVAEDSAFETQLIETIKLGYGCMHKIGEDVLRLHQAV